MGKHTQESSSQWEDRVSSIEERQTRNLRWIDGSMYVWYQQLLKQNSKKYQWNY